MNVKESNEQFIQVEECDHVWDLNYFSSFSKNSGATCTKCGKILATNEFFDKVYAFELFDVNVKFFNKIYGEKKERYFSIEKTRLCERCGDGEEVIDSILLKLSKEEIEVWINTLKRMRE